MSQTRRSWLITGGAGFIGSHLVKELVRTGQRVCVLDNFSSSTADNLSSVSRDIRLLEGDIRSLPVLLDATRDVDFVLHHAALVSVPKSLQNPQETAEINIQGTQNVLEAARRNGVKKVLFASSCAVYGNGLEIPYKETAAMDCLSPYALSKQAAEELCQFYTRVYGLETAILRYFNVFGPGQDPNSAYAAVIAKFMQLARQGKPLTIDGDGKQERDFVHVADIVRANLLAADRAVPGEIYNVGRGESVSLLELADLLERVCGRPLQRLFRPKREADVRISRANIAKISALGFHPSVSLEKGLTNIWSDGAYSVF